MTKKLLLKEVVSDASQILRAARRDDLDTVVQLISDACKVDGGTDIVITPDKSAHESINIKQDTFLIETRDEHVDGNEGLLNVDHCCVSANGRIHSKVKGPGIGTSLLDAMEVRRHEHVQPSTPDRRGLVRVQTKNKHPHSTKKHK